MADGNKPGQKQHTLCWDCAKATTGECNWSQAEDYSPVPGWTAIPTVIHSTLESGRTDSYIVIKCPEFKRDAELFGQRRL